MRKERTRIESLQGPTSTPIFKDNDILNEFVTFYKNLYTPETLPEQSDLSSYFQSIASPPSNHIDFDSPGSYISLADISYAVSVLRHGKAPGPDGFTIELYDHFVKILLPNL